MKLKGISIWEQHIEKIVLAAAVLVFLVLTALQLLTNPNAQSIPGRGNLNPGQVDAYLKEMAETLLVQMGRDAPGSEEMKYVPILPEMKKEIADPISPGKQLAANFRPNIFPEISGATYAGKPYFVPKPAAPDPIVVAQCANALAPDEVKSFEGLAALFPTGAEPYDMAWTTPACRWDQADFLNQLQGKTLPAGSDELLAVPIPWRSATTIVDVVFEREEMVGDHWTNLTALAPMPGRSSFRPQLAGALTGKDRDDLLQRLGDPAVKTEILRPPFYATKTEACPPPDLNAQPGQQPGENPVGALKREVARAKDDLAALEADLTKKGGPVSEPEDPGKKPPKGKPGSGAGGGGGEAPPGGGIGSGGGSSGAGGPGKHTGAPGSASPASVAIRKKLMKDIEKKKTELARLQADLDKMTAKAPETGPKVVDTEGSIELWTHDITAQPGKTYHYRATVKVVNPFFGHQHNLVPDQQRLSSEVVLSSAPSEWSQPIRVTPWLRQFVIAATPPSPDRVFAGESGLGQVVMDVFRFYDGRWHEKKFPHVPGDRIGGKETVGGRDGQPQVVIDFTTDWYVLDIVEDVSGGDSDSARSGKAILQAMGDRQTEYRDPRVDNADPDYKWLKSQAEVRVAHQ